MRRVGAVHQGAPGLAAGLLAGLALVLPTAAQASYEAAVTSDAVRDGEPSLGVSPTDPSNLAMGYMKVGRGQCAVAASFDRGRTWDSQVLDEITDPFYSFCADPTLVFGSDGTAYLAAIAFNQSFQVGHTVVTRSGDGGKTWTRPVEAVGPESAAEGVEQGQTAPVDGFDRPWLAFDPRTGTLYLTTMSIFSRPMGTLAHRYLVASEDRGKSWGEMSVVDSPRYPADHWATGTIAVARDGTVAIAYTARQVPEGTPCPCAVLATTRDGVDFRHHTVPLGDTLLGVSLPEQGPFPALRLVYGPVVAADPTRPGSYAVAVAGWEGLGRFLVGQTGGESRSAVRAQLLLTADSGRSWGGPVVLGEDPAKDREHIWLGYSPPGALGVIWRTHAGACCFGSTDVWAVVSRHGGRRFGSPRRLSRAPSPFTGGLGDDFQSVVLDRAFLHAAWGDVRTGEQDVYYGRLPLPARAARRHGAIGPRVRRVITTRTRPAR